MKNLSRLFLFLLFSTTLVAQDATAPSPQEIADAYVETIGGKDAWLALSSMSMAGKVTTQGMDIPMSITTAEGDKMRLDLDIQGSPMTQAYDGQTGRMIFPMQGITEPKDMTEEEAADFADSPFLSEFINSEERGYTLAAVDGKEVDGTQTYGVRVTNDKNFDRTYYFDTETMVPLMIEAVSKGGPMKGMTMNSYMSDYQETEGLMLPMFMEQKINGQTAMKMTFTEVKLNPDIKEGFFELKD